KNISVIAADNNPVIDLVQSNHILFDRISCKKDADVLLRVSGDRVKKIDVINTAISGIKEKLVTDSGADAKEIKL
ncbi:MAG TPA: hypothetical protein VK645_04340, partial [Chitinophagaceae bacterium]|nr:hypothetical protein [Chitinophagaceae bacterium]